jgi:hypothetical protein
VSDASPPDVFVSHAHEDRDRAQPLAIALREHGMNAWFDQWEIQPGDSIVQKIFEEGLKNCKVFLVLLSRASIQSRWVREELDVALVRRLEGTTKVVPILLEPCELPTALKPLAWVDMADGIDQVVRKIADVAFGRRSVPPIGPPPSGLPYRVPQLSDLAARVAVHLSGSLDAPKGTPQAYGGAQLSQALSLPPDELNDAIDELESRGLVEVRHRLGTAPYTFALVEPTYALGLQLKGTPALTYDPEQDIRAVANAVVALRRCRGPKLQEYVGLSAARINNAADYLEDVGALQVRRLLGTGPFTFAELVATSATRRFVANLRSLDDRMDRLRSAIGRTTEELRIGIAEPISSASLEVARKGERERQERIKRGERVARIYRRRENLPGLEKVYEAGVSLDEARELLERGAVWDGPDRYRPSVTELSNDPDGGSVMAAKDREEQWADDLYGRAVEVVGDEGGSTLKEVEFELVAEDEIRAAQILVRRGVAQLRGNRITIAVDTLPPWLKK